MVCEMMMVVLSHHLFWVQYLVFDFMLHKKGRKKPLVLPPGRRKWALYVHYVEKTTMDVASCEQALTRSQGSTQSYFHWASGLNWVLLASSQPSHHFTRKDCRFLQNKQADMLSSALVAIPQLSLLASIVTS